MSIIKASKRGVSSFGLVSNFAVKAESAGTTYTGELCYLMKPSQAVLLGFDERFVAEGVEVDRRYFNGLFALHHTFLGVVE